MKIQAFLMSMIVAIPCALISFNSNASSNDELGGYTRGCSRPIAPVYRAQHAFQNCPTLEGTWSNSSGYAFVFQPTVTYAGNKTYKYCAHPQRICDNDTFQWWTFDTNNSAPHPLVYATTICNDLNTINFIGYFENRIMVRHQVKLMTNGDLEVQVCADWGEEYKAVLKRNN